VIEKQELLRRIPSVEKVLEVREIVDLGRELPRWTIAESVRGVLAVLRKSISSGARTGEAEMDEIVSGVRASARRLARRGIRKVINATGVIIHTNLGRSCLSEQAMDAVREVATSYSTLEFDLDEGRRTSRTAHVEKLLCRIVGCDDAFAVNNNAGAVLLALNALAEGKEVIVSRGELVEIGGSFRLPDVMEKSGARMVDIGTTNRTRIEDYEKAITESTAILLKVHRSNFMMTGYVESVSSAALSELAHRSGLLMMEDLGSGALVDLSSLGTTREPLPQEFLRDGADMVTFSGDKLLGGPQAGVIVGRGDLVEKMKKNPLARALRMDKMSLAALEETLRQYLEPDTVAEKVPALKAISTPPAEIKKRVDAFCLMLSKGLGRAAEVTASEGESQIGGGSLPGTGLKTFLVGISRPGLSANEAIVRLRQCAIPVIARIVEDKVILDLRTVQPGEDEILAHQVIDALAAGGEQVERS
jgi:L-seryl-tRNA(Ser) seleniumtransferase